jgi:hypothetical protein
MNQKVTTQTARIDAIGQNGNDGEHYEIDPNGLDIHAPGAKVDAGKPMVALVLGDFSDALMKVSEVGTFGAKKYSPHGWLEVPQGVERYSDAMLRHFCYEASGEEIDPDSGIEHAAHLAWNALARLQLMLNEKNEPR